MPYDQIDVTEDAGIVTITFSRPERLNALAGHMRRDLAEALEAAGAERSVHVVVITGAGRAFCARGRVAASWARDLAEAVEAAGAERSVHVVVITGAGRAFCAGGDVAAMADLIERQDAEEFSRLLGSSRRGITCIR